MLRQILIEGAAISHVIIEGEILITLKCPIFWYHVSLAQILSDRNIEKRVEVLDFLAQLMTMIRYIWIVHTSNGRPPGPLRADPRAVVGGVETPDISGANNLPAADANPSGNCRSKTNDSKLTFSTSYC